MRSRWNRAGGRVLVAATCLALVAAPALAADRRVRVGGWLVEDAAEDDGGHVVSLSRRGAGIDLEYKAIFWHGNHGIIHDVEVEGCIGEPFRSPDPAVVTAASVRERFLARLAECGTPPEQAASALDGFEGAFRVAADWSADAARARSAEIEAIVNYGSAEPVASPVADPPSPSGARHDPEETSS